MPLLFNFILMINDGCKKNEELKVKKDEIFSKNNLPKNEFKKNNVLFMNKIK